MFIMFWPVNEFSTSLVCFLRPVSIMLDMSGKEGLLQVK